jgi:uncharacterized cupredoxin-like copper-binding protein
VISLRVAAVATASAVALGAATILGGGVAAQDPAGAPSPAPSSSSCRAPSAGPGMMGSGPGSSMSAGMMDQGSGMGHDMMGATATPGTVPSPSQAATTSVTAVRIAVTLTDDFRIDPCSMTVSAGVPVTFVVTNGGAIAHEFFLGDEAAQAAHAEEMLSMGGASMHDEPDGIAVAAGETKELTYTFASPGQYLAGCHVPGHYAAGMKAVIDVIG